MVRSQSSLHLFVWGALSWPLRRADNEAVAATRLLGEHAMLLKLFAQGMGMNFYFAKEVLRLWGVFSQTNLRVRRPATAPDPLALRELYERLERLGLTHGGRDVMTCKVKKPTEPARSGLELTRFQHRNLHLRGRHE